MKFPSWMSSPFVGILGVLISVGGIIFGIYAYYTTKEIWELRYAESPERSVLIDATKASDFEIKYKGQEIKTDITSVTMTLWSQGTRAIRPSNILEPIKIKLGSNTPILEAKILRVSRSVTGFTLDDRDKEKGFLFPKWDILEKHDGAVVQIIYAGPSTIDIVMSGVVEGKNQIRLYKTKHEFPKHLLIVRWAYIVALIPALTFMRIIMYVRSSARYAKRWKFEAFLWFNIVVMFITMLFFPYWFNITELPVKF